MDCDVPIAIHFLNLPSSPSWLQFISESLQWAYHRLPQSQHCNTLIYHRRFWYPQIVVPSLPFTFMISRIALAYCRAQHNLLIHRLWHFFILLTLAFTFTIPWHSHLILTHHWMHCNTGACRLGYPHFYTPKHEHLQCVPYSILLMLAFTLTISWHPHLSLGYYTLQHVPADWGSFSFIHF